MYTRFLNASLVLSVNSRRLYQLERLPASDDKYAIRTCNRDGHGGINRGPCKGTSRHPTAILLVCSYLPADKLRYDKNQIHEPESTTHNRRLVKI
jgi:hypothetical protein